MPIGDFPGNFGWGYDGVNFFAPTHLCGTPDDSRGFVNHAHARSSGLRFATLFTATFGPDGNYRAVYSERLFDAFRETKTIGARVG